MAMPHSSGADAPGDRRVALNRRAVLLTALAWPMVSAAHASPAWRLVDMMPAFWSAYDASRSDARAEGLWARFFEPNLAVYAQAGVKIEPRHVAGWLPEFESLAAPVRRLSSEFGVLARPALARFQTALPDFDTAAAKVIILPSLFRFDGHLEPGGRELPLFVGPDGIVKYHGATPDLGVFLTHELFHLYQAQAAPDLALDPNLPVFVVLWIEGMATYASERLNPGASRRHVLLDDAPLANASAETIQAVARFALAQLDSADGAALGALFSAGQGGDLPTRGGYLVGLEIARRAARSRSLGELARLSRPQMRELIARELAAIAQ